MDPALSVVIVAYNSGPDLARTLPSLARELAPGDEVIVVDNGSDGSLIPLLAEHLPQARLEVSGANRGFAAAANRGAELARNDLLLLLNPDAAPLEGFGAAIRRPASRHPDWDAWMGLVACPIDGGLRINTCGNPIHFTGIVFAGGYGEPLRNAGVEREVPTASGACLVVRREVWSRVGGFPAEYFLYHEDADLSLRIRAAGGRIGLAPDAVVEHDYEFDSSPAKSFWLERNRLATLIRNYPSGLLMLIAPVLAATELAMLPLAARRGWLGQKLRAWRDLIRWLPRLLAERGELARRRVLTTADFARILTADLDTPMLPRPVRTGPLAWLLKTWWRLVLALLR